VTASADHPPPEDHRPDERRKMTVSERDIGALATDLHGWLASRLGHPGRADGQRGTGPGSAARRAGGCFEHASMGRHDPTGFADWSSVAP
jgi:hypothetical protein